MLYDFHTHTFLTDGVLLPIELIRRAVSNGYTAIAVTDHLSVSNLDSIIPAIIADCKLAEDYWHIRAVPGVELTHVPPEVIPQLAREARQRGARLVIVHGETPAEPVCPGTNLAAAHCPEVDILAHPGPIDAELAELAARNAIFLELSAHVGHCLGNGAVAQAARRAGARLLVNSDAHLPDEVLTEDAALRVALGAGLTPEEAETALITNAQALLTRTEQGNRSR